MRWPGGCVMLVAFFLLLLFSPCFVSYLGGDLVESSFLGERQVRTWALPRFRRAQAWQPVLKLEEEPVSEGFVLRSFAKGISQRRVVIQDVVEGVRMTIAEVRAVVIEAARTARAFFEDSRESRAELLHRLAHQARMALAQAVIRGGRARGGDGEDYARACDRLRWSESTTEAGWAADRRARVAA